MTRAITHFISYTDIRIKAAYLILGVGAFLLTLYASNLYTVVSNTVALKQIQKSVASVSAEVEDLDAEYLELSSRITPDRLSSFDLAPGQVSYFISRSTSRGVVAIGGNER